eukprot:TRINITY_DN1168_c0_g2_i13.p1 TRINITY_DN1168_c0_g2~~TRINITY_DN1168_c0_g2_i13.p1  ORF type:complete len:704 (+),score=229.18 TRINITY_DN1168_c0_g2_i13:269-2113(+)
MPSPAAGFVAPGVGPSAVASAFTAPRVSRARPGGKSAAAGGHYGVTTPLRRSRPAPSGWVAMVGKVDTNTETTSGESLLESDATEEVLARQSPEAPATVPEVDPAVRNPPKPAEPSIVPTPVDYVVPRRETFAGLVWDRISDSLTDARMHYGRMLLPKQKVGSVAKPRVIVLGSGWGAHALIKVLDCDLYDVTVISPRNAFAFTPMLAAASVGTVEFRSLLEPVRVANELVDYVQASATSVDMERQTVSCVSDLGRVEGEEPVTFDLPYSYLIVAVGATTNTFGVPGVREHAFFLKSVVDARKIRAAIVNRFERANLPTTSEEEKDRLLHTVVIGGGPTGVEYCAELNDFLTSDLRRKYPRLVPLVRVTLLQSGDAILTAFDETLQGAAMENFESSNVEVVLNARVVNIGPTMITLKDGTEVDYGMAIWAAGNGTTPLVKSLITSIPDQAGARGRLRIDDWLRVKGATNVFALGDAACNDDDPMPATAQVAAQQAAYAARLLNRDYCLSCEIPEASSPRKGLSKLINGSGEDGDKMRVAKPFQFLSLGLLAYIGRDRALAQVELGKKKIFLSGAATRLLYDSVYATKQVSFRNRVLVLVDWAKTKVFGRDLSQF